MRDCRVAKAPRNDELSKIGTAPIISRETKNHKTYGSHKSKQETGKQQETGTTSTIYFASKNGRCPYFSIFSWRFKFNVLKKIFIAWLVPA